MKSFAPQNSSFTKKKFEKNTKISKKSFENQNISNLFNIYHKFIATKCPRLTLSDLKNPKNYRKSALLKLGGTLKYLKIFWHFHNRFKDAFLRPPAGAVEEPGKDAAVAVAELDLVDELWLRVRLDSAAFDGLGGILRRPRLGQQFDSVFFFLEMNLDQFHFNLRRDY